VGLILCVTLILLPLGIPVLMLARRVFTLAGRMVVPRAVRHPLEELDRSSEATASKLKGKAKRSASASADKAQGTRKAATKRAKEGAKHGRKAVKRGAGKAKVGAASPAKRAVRRLRKSL
jgi:hypothetical protein